MPDARVKFEEWYKGGMEVLALSIEGGRAYFASETHKALASIEQAMSGMPLRRMARSLKLFAEGLCGNEIFIRSLRRLRALAEDSTPTDCQRGWADHFLARYPTPVSNTRRKRSAVHGDDGS